MANELGLAVTPWGPLRSGTLSGKYTRENAGAMKGDRGIGDLTGLYGMTEKVYTIIDQLSEIAQELGTTIAAVALAWVQGRPGVTSTLVGARTLRQLDENLTALELHLSPAHVAALDTLSEPTLNFPSQMLKTSPHGAHAGATVNGTPSIAMLPTLPNNEKERY
jgi:aryl-alcohol dehydrogenase-like predicted oxidoreductase